MMKGITKLKKYVVGKIKKFLILNKLKKFRDSLSFIDDSLNDLVNITKNKKLISNEEYNQLLKQINNYYIKCVICKKKLHLTTDFKCIYCNRYHCDKHRLPEHHRCKGTPKGMPPRNRELYSSRKGRIVLSR